LFNVSCGHGPVGQLSVTHKVKLNSGWLLPWKTWKSHGIAKWSRKSM